MTSDAVLNITSVVRESIKQNGKKRLYAGDLGVAADTVEKVSSLVKKVDSSEKELLSIAKVCRYPFHIKFLRIFLNDGQ